MLERAVAGANGSRPAPLDPVEHYNPYKDRRDRFRRVDVEGAMENRPGPVTRRDLLDRRERLVSARSARGSTADLDHLLAQVDSALERHEQGTFGICVTCGDPIEPELLRSDPLTSVCIDHLSPEERDSLERDLVLAGRVQRALLPRQDAVAGGWEIRWHFEPAGHVSGDYCDVILPGGGDGGPLVFVVADVSGTGVAAALLSAHLNALFRTLVDAGFGVDEMMRRANRLFCESTLDSRYATLVAGRAYPDGTLELSNAGQPAPVVVRTVGAVPVEGAGLPLGMFCSIDYPVERLTLDPDESLVVFTDGVTETRNVAGEEFGADGVLGALRGRRDHDVAGTASRCLDAVNAFRGAAPRTDDVTLLVIRRSDSRAG